MTGVLKIKCFMKYTDINSTTKNILTHYLLHYQERLFTDCGSIVDSVIHHKYYKMLRKIRKPFIIITCPYYMKHNASCFLHIIYVSRFYEIQSNVSDKLFEAIFI